MLTLTVTIEQRYESSVIKIDCYSWIHICMNLTVWKQQTYHCQGSRERYEWILNGSGDEQCICCVKIKICPFHSLSTVKLLTNYRQTTNTCRQWGGVVHFTPTPLQTPLLHAIVCWLYRTDIDSISILIETARYKSRLYAISVHVLTL